jgi:hypothetical protein
MSIAILELGIVVGFLEPVMNSSVVSQKRGLTFNIKVMEGLRSDLRTIIVWRGNVGSAS